MNKLRFTAALAAILVFSALSFAQDDSITLRAGNELHVQLITTLSPKDNDSGDYFTGKVTLPVFGKGGEIVPEGSTVVGHITFVKGPGQEKKKDKGEMHLIVDSISYADGSKYNITTNLEKAQDMTAKGEPGGFLSVVARRVSKGKNSELPAGTEVTFTISRDITAKKVPNRQ